MKMLISTLLIFCSISAFAAKSKISAKAAVLVARTYVATIKYPIGGSIKKVITAPLMTTDSSYNFNVFNEAGNCALLVVVNFDGSVDEELSQETCF